MCSERVITRADFPLKYDFFHEGLFLELVFNFFVICTCSLLFLKSVFLFFELLLPLVNYFLQCTALLEFQMLVMLYKWISSLLHNLLSILLVLSLWQFVKELYNFNQQILSCLRDVQLWSQFACYLTTSKASCLLSCFLSLSSSCLWGAAFWLSLLAYSSRTLRALSDNFQEQVNCL